ncbi:MAG: hypothetical protein CMJ78_17525, partial [Planctomycetaceae bacterium]|nr:hypothetical protein [Planctomycetaceae bacterium]
ILHERSLRDKLSQIADELGLEFLPDGDDALMSQLAGFHLFSQGRRRRMRNLMLGEANGLEVAIFDYRYETTGSGKHSKTHKLSVICFTAQELDLPKFALRPEGLFHKIGSALGFQDIDFDSHPKFSSAYLLQGANESAIRELFNDEVLEFFDSSRKLCVEGHGDHLCFYRRGRRIAPEHVKDFMAEGFVIYKLFRGDESE